MPFAPESQLHFGPAWMVDDAHPISGARCHTMTFGKVGTGDDPIMVDEPGGADRRVLLLKADTLNDESFVNCPVAFAATDGAAITTRHDDINFEWVGAMNWNSQVSTSKLLTILRVQLGDGVTSDKWFALSEVNGGKIRYDDSDAGTLSTAGAEITEDAITTITVYYHASTGVNDGSVEVFVNGVSKLTVTHDIQFEAEVFALKAHSQGPTHAGIVLRHYIQKVGFFRASERTKLGVLTYPIGTLTKDDPGMGVLSGKDKNRISVSWFLQPESFRHSWGVSDDIVVNVEVAAGTFTDGSFPSSGTTTHGPFTADGAYEFVGCGITTGLTPDTDYTLRLLITSPANSGDGTYIGPVLHCKTMPDTARSIIFSAIFCEQPEVYGHQTLELLANANVEFCIHMGDKIYVDAVPVYPADASGASLHPSGDTTWYLRSLHRVFCDNQMQVTGNREVCELLIPDDHDLNTNNWTAGDVKGFAVTINGVEYNAAATGGSLRATTNTIVGAPYTRGQVYDNLGVAWHEVFSKAYLNPIYDGGNWYDIAHTRWFEMANSLWLMVDTRRFQDDATTEPFSAGVGQQLGAHQEAWLIDRLTKTKKQAIHFFSPANISDLHVQNDDWQLNADRRAQWHRIEAAIIANDSIHAMFCYSGDRHAACIDTRNNTADYGRTGAFDKLVVHSRVGAAGAGAPPAFFTEVITDRVDHTDAFGSSSAGRPVKGFPIYTWDDAMLSLHIDVIKSDDEVSQYDATYRRYPVVAQGVASSTIKSSKQMPQIIEAALGGI